MTTNPPSVCPACGGPVKVEKGGNSQGHFMLHITCVGGCRNFLKAMDTWWHGRERSTLEKEVADGE